LARTRDPLLGYAAVGIGGNQSSFRVAHGPAQREIRDAGLVSKACERFGFERSHP
jgi:hypothetical protein